MRVVVLRVMRTIQLFRLLLLSVTVASGCAGGDDDRPSTWREVCEMNAAVDCAFEARKDECAGRTADAACEPNFVTQCCATAGNCDAAPSFSPATFGEFADCRAAVVMLSCSAVDSGTRPDACEGVVK